MIELQKSFPIMAKRNSDMPGASSVLLLDLGLLSSDEDVLNAGRILKVSLAEGHVEPIIEKQQLPDSVGVCRRRRRILWTCMGVPGAPDGSVWSACWDGSDIINLISPGVLNTPKQLIVDQWAEKLYICDREGLRIVRCNLDGGQIEEVVRTGDNTNAEHRADTTRWCVGLALDWERSKIYWTQKGPPKGNQGRIFRASVDLTRDYPSAPVVSSEEIECVLEDLPEPIHLELDSRCRMLYWTDRGDLPYGNSLNRCRLSALDDAATIGAPLKATVLIRPPYEVLARNFHEAIGLKLNVDNDIIFVTDLAGSLYSVATKDGFKRRLYEDLGACSGICLV